MILTLLHLGLLIAQTPAQGPHSGRVDGLVIVSTDESLYKQALRDLKPPQPLAEVSKTFSSEEILVASLGFSDALIIDLTTGSIGRLTRIIRSMKAIARALDTNLTFTLNELPPKERLGIIRLLSPLATPSAWPMDSSNPAVGLDGSTNFVVERDGRRVTVQLPLHTYGEEKQNEQLARSPLVKKPVTELMQRNDLEQLERTASDEARISMTFTHMARTRMREAHRAASEHLTALIEELEGQQRAASDALLSKFNGLGGGRLPTGNAAFKELPKSTQEAILQHVRANFRQFGFTNEVEAEAFVLNSKNVATSTSLGLKACVATGSPPTFGMVVISTVRGGRGQE